MKHLQGHAQTWWFTNKSCASSCQKFTSKGSERIFSLFFIKIFPLIFVRKKYHFYERNLWIGYFTFHLDNCTYRCIDKKNFQVHGNFLRYISIVWLCWEVFFNSIPTIIRLYCSRLLHLKNSTDTYKRSDSMLWIEKYSIEFKFKGRLEGQL